MTLAERQLSLKVLELDDKVSVLEDVNAMLQNENRELLDALEESNAQIEFLSVKATEVMDANDKAWKSLAHELNVQKVKNVTPGIGYCIGYDFHNERFSVTVGLGGKIPFINSLLGL